MVQSGIQSYAWSEQHLLTRE